MGRKPTNVLVKPPSENVFLEAMALTTHPHPEAEATWRTARRRRTPWHQPQSLLASGQDVRRAHGHDPTVAVRSRTCVSQISLERACSPAANRRMRTRTYGGVGAGRGNPSGYLIWPAESTQRTKQWCNFVRMKSDDNLTVGKTPLQFLHVRIRDERVVKFQVREARDGF